MLAKVKAGICKSAATHLAQSDALVARIEAERRQHDRDRWRSLLFPRLLWYYGAALVLALAGWWR